ncbi:MAG: DUF2079 domain-containing protein, partial [Thermoleophilia bacterium]|nr:DUF2079 domain-containing protein [Thermoleophilia bacterium]
LAYLLYPPLEWATLSEFHPVTVSCPLLLFAFWYLDEHRLLPFALFAGAAALGKEQIPLVIAAMGIWYALARRRWAAGAAIALLGTATAVVAVEVVVPHFSEGESPFYGRYREVGGSPAGVLETAVTDPGHLLAEGFDARGLSYLAALVLPLAGASLAAPLAVLVALPDLALNLLSSVENQTSVEHHYAAGVTPGLVVAAVFGAARLPRPTAAALVVVAAALAANYRLGALPVWHALPGGAARPAQLVRVSEHDRRSARLLERIPDGATVSATNTLGAHLSARRRVLSFPRVTGAGWVAVDETRPSLLDRSAAGEKGRRAIARLRRDPRWRIVAADDGVLVFRRVRAGRPAAGGRPTARS